MAIFDQFKVPQIPRRQIDPAQLAQFLAAPEVARQQVRGQLFQNLSQLPQNIFNTVGQIGQYQQQQRMNPLELQKVQAETQELQAKAEQQRASAEKLRRISTVAQKEPAVFAEAMKNLRSNISFITTNDPDVRKDLINQEIDMVKSAMQQSQGLPSSGAPSNLGLKKQKTAQDLRAKFGY